MEQIQDALNRYKSESAIYAAYPSLQDLNMKQVLAVGFDCAKSGAFEFASACLALFILKHNKTQG